MSVLKFETRSPSADPDQDSKRLLAAHDARPMRGAGNRGLGLTPVASALALVLAAGGAGLAGVAHAGPAAFSGAWFTAKAGAQSQTLSSGKTANGTLAGIPTAAVQQQQSRQELARSLDNLNRTAAAIAAQQAAQAAARAAAGQDPSMPDGVTPGGLWDKDAAGNALAWSGADRPVQTTRGGKTVVDIRQTADKAILNWDTFNVGRDTTVKFDQKSTDAVLNRVVGDHVAPSRVQGSIEAAGTVMVLNQNGVVFTGSSQVNVRNLVAAAAKMTDDQFTTNGIYGAMVSGALQPSFADAAGNVLVQAGAQLNTATPQSVTDGGGYVLLLGSEVHNDGQITTPRGQAALAAGDSFFIRKGVGTDANAYSTTRGNEVVAQFAADSKAGLVQNTGLLQSPEGDITLTGRRVRQDGVALSTTTVNNRGTLHLSTSASDDQGSVAFGANGVTAILIDDSGGTALDSQRESLIEDSARQDQVRRNAPADIFDNLSRLDDRRDLSRIEVVSGGDIDFESGSLTLATGGQVTASATRRSTVANGAEVDVAGAVGVQIAMASNNIQINIQGNEQRDAPLNRDAADLNNSDIWVDRRSLVYVAPGVGGYQTARWYTAGGLLEVGGYLDVTGHSIGEWTAQGGTVAFSGGELVTQAGGAINVSGGTLDVQAGYINQSWMRGADGRLYEISTAPADIAYTGLYKGYEDVHARWGNTRYFYNPLIAPRRRYEDGYTVGRDAGALVVSTNSAVLQGDLVGDTYQGIHQGDAPSDADDGYLQTQNAVARGSQLILGRYQSAFNFDTKNGPVGVFHNLAPTLEHIVFGDTDGVAPADRTTGSTGNTSITGGSGAAVIDPSVDLPEDSKGMLLLNSDALTRMGLGSIAASATEDITVERALGVTPGGQIALYAPTVQVDADLTARAGSIVLGNVLDKLQDNGLAVDIQLAAPAGVTPGVVVGAGVTLDAHGMWSNLRDDPYDLRYLPYADGGSVTVRSTGDATLQAGSVIDVSSGAVLRNDGTLQGGTGGDVTLAAGHLPDATVDPLGGILRLDGEVRAYGVNGGGTLTIEAAQAIGLGLAPVGGDGVLRAGETSTAALRLANDYVVQAGEKIPFSYSVTVKKIAPGANLSNTYTPSVSFQTPLTLAADWVVPAGVSFVSFSGPPFSAAPGQTVPAGAIMTSLSLGSGFVVPADVFPGGIPVRPVTTSYTAGTVVSQPLTVAAGTLMQPGTAMPADVAVRPVLTLADDLFKTGFAHYDARSHDGVTLADGATVDVYMPVYRWDGTVQAPASGADPARALQLWTPPLFQEHPESARLEQRLGADLTLRSGSINDTDVPIYLGEGSTLSVDPGQSISLLSNGGQVTLDGRVNAWGGQITVDTSQQSGSAAIGFSPYRSIWVGEHAVLDAAARAYVARDADGRAYGVAPDGGSIALGPTDNFVIIRPGAVLDASGSQATVDLSAGTKPGGPAQPALLAGAGGSILLRSTTGIHIDGNLRAFAGGPGAAGGVLSVYMDSRVYGSPDYDASGALPDALMRMHNLTLTQDKPESRLAADLAPGQADDGLIVGDTELGADQVVAGGFDSLTLSTQDLFIFKGDIDLALGRSLNLKGGVYTVDADTPDAHVVLRAPYVRLDGGYPIEPDNLPWSGTVGAFTPGLINKGGVNMSSAVSGESALAIDADLIDLYGTILSGTGGLQGDGPISSTGGFVVAKRVDIPGFATVGLDASGDVRLGDKTLFYAGGDIDIQAAQIYPMSGATATIVAGRRSVLNQFGNPISQVLSDQTLRIRSSGQSAPMPASVFGKLVLQGGTVDQGGIVRAPLGVITINDNPQLFGTATLDGFTDGSTIVLRQGSVTSVSAAGLVMPFGGTPDGLNYAGATTFTALPGGIRDLGDIVTGIGLGGNSIAVEAGAILDLSGGGDLRGAGFTTGRGGSVDVLTTPLVNANPVANGYSAASNQVYAILPGYASAYAPVIADKGAGDPAIGRQIQIGAGVPGLPAGTYTLLPASYALMPGAFRVEVAATPSTTPGVGTQPALAVPNGSWQTTGVLSVANTGVRDSLPTQVLVTPGDAVRKFSQYNEMTYADFAVQQAARFGGVRPLLPADGKVLRFDFIQSDDKQALDFAGQVLLGGAQGGAAGNVVVIGNQPIEITADGATPTAGSISLSANDLNAMKAASMSIGGWYSYFDGASTLGDSPRIYFTQWGPGSVTVREGATLAAGQLFLIGQTVSVDKSAVLDTRGFGAPLVDSSLGYLYANSLKDSGGGIAVLAVSNGWLDFLPSQGSGRISVADGASLLTDGTIGFVAPGDLALGDVNLGARYLTVSQNQVNIGNDAALDQARAAGVLPDGWQLTQDLLQRLLRPAADSGLPALERLALTANTINYFGSVTLDTGDSKAQLVISTPAFYGWGSANDEVRLVTDTLVWNGVSTGSGTATDPYASAAPVVPVPGGPGSGSGRLVLDVNAMIFGYDARARAQSQTALDRLALGFSDVRIDAADSVTANNKGTLSVGLARDASGAMQGGSLEINTPLLTGQSGSMMTYTAGGDIHVALPAGAAAGKTDAVQDLGASLEFKGRGVTLDTAVALPSGTLSVQADGDIVLGANAAIDLSGRHVDFFDVSRDTWGGDLTLESAGGGISQLAGSVIDVSAPASDAGTIQGTALADGATVQWGGTLRGTGAQGFNQGSYTQASGLLDSAGFAALNAMLGDAGFNGARNFRIKHGDLVVGDGVRANQITIELDDGSLTVNGKLDASGAGPGRIDLTASNNLTVAAGALLDAHATSLATDSYGAPIDAQNQARISLTTNTGTVTLADGARMDLSTPDGIARGLVDINAPRTGAQNDIAVDARGSVAIAGARSIAVNGFRTYVLPDGSTIDQAYLDGVDADNTAFINAAWNNAGLQDRLVGLKAYGAAFHLRPGVELRSDGNLSTQGDLDLSGYRYGPGVDPALRGSGEAGVLVVRAAGDLDINGSINDGFGLPGHTPDTDVYGALKSNETLNTAYLATGGELLTAGTKLPLAGSLGFPVTLTASANVVYPSSASPTPVDLVLALVTPINKGATNPNKTLGADVVLPTGVVYTAGTLLTALPASLPAGTVLKAGTVMLTTAALGIRVKAVTLSVGTPIAFFSKTDYTLTVDRVLSAGDTLPVGTFVSSLNAVVGQRPVWATAPMLAPGSASWSMRLVSGADVSAADSRTLQSSSALAAAGLTGDMTLDDPHDVTIQGTGGRKAGVSVIRTGTGDLELLVGGSYAQESPFGVYTAGTAIDSASSAPYNLGRPLQADGTVLGAANAAYEGGLDDTRMWMPTQGGDFTLAAQGDILGYQTQDNEAVGQWLWRQGGAGLNQPTAWGINFGSYVLNGMGSEMSLEVPGFAGVGTLGGGNVTVRAGGNIGMPNGAASGEGSRSLLVAVGSSGRVVDGQVVQTGGGALNVTAGGQIAGGQFAGLRGDTDVTAGSAGYVAPRGYGFRVGDQRPLDPYTPYAGWSSGGVSFAPGDGAVRVRTLGDLVVDGLTDPGRAVTSGETGASNADGVVGFGATWFTLWTPATQIDLVSAGGNLTPVGSDGGTSVLPSVLRAAALGGSIYYSASGNALLMPSADSQLELLARDLVSADSANDAQNRGGVLGILATSTASIPTPLNPAWRLGGTTSNSVNGRVVLDSNYWGDDGSNPSSPGPLDSVVIYDEAFLRGQVAGAGGTMFMFGPNTVTDRSALSGEGTRIYALSGDIVGANVGQILNVGDSFRGTATQYYQSAGPVRLLAGGDIVNSRGLIVQDGATDVSLIAAQGSVLYSNFSIAGPGTLEVSAGGQFYQGNNNSLISLGPLVPGDLRPGADIVVQAGLGAGQPGVGATDFDDFARQYLDPANQAATGVPLADQPGKVVHVYDQELALWLRDRFGYAGAAGADALAYFQALAPEQQRIFVRQVYYAELLAGGREYNDADGPRFGSYLRGRQTIATLFPAADADGTPILRTGNITLYQGEDTNAGIRTVKGGSIQTLTPGGQTVVGVEGLAPSTSASATPAGLITQGQGDIQMYSQGSILLGLSRIMTTFGGGILAWSAQGDINAGRGTKTTIVYTPPSLVYDDLGNVKLTPQVPSTGAGIATLAPIVEVPAGDVDLIAPLGTIDAGEAGIRVSGNINVAALHIINAANIQVQGKSTGIPVVTAVNVSALTSASAAANAAANTAQDAIQRSRAQAQRALPSIISVQVLGFGNEPVSPFSAPPPRSDANMAPRVSYRQDSAVQVVGDGSLSDGQRARLSPDERNAFGL